MLTSRTEQLLKTVLFGGIVAFLVFVLMNFWSYYDLHIVLWNWISGWSLRTHIEVGIATAFFLIFGTIWSLRILRRNMSNVVTYDR
jgi:hypothetical protein